MMRLHNVIDGRFGFVGSWDVEPLVYEELSPEHVGRTVIYARTLSRSTWGGDAGTITSWRNGIVFARYSRGDTSAGALPAALLLAADACRL